MAKDRKEYMRNWNKSHKEERKAYLKANREREQTRSKAYYQKHKEDLKARNKIWYQTHKEEKKSYNKADVNSLGQTKSSIRAKSKRFLNKFGTKIPGYEIHHCCTYTEPYKFIYCPKEMHQHIHSYLREHKIDADTDHYEQIKHLLDDSVVLYGINDQQNQ